MVTFNWDIRKKGKDFVIIMDNMIVGKAKTYKRAIYMMKQMQNDITRKTKTGKWGKKLR